MIGLVDFREWPGYRGMFTREQAPGALPNGTVIEKIESEPWDSTPNGSTGKVLGSLRSLPAQGALLLYFIEWDHTPKAAVACMATKVKEKA